jgi:hypothetical protein
MDCSDVALGLSVGYLCLKDKSLLLSGSPRCMLERAKNAIMMCTDLPLPKEKIEQSMMSDQHSQRKFAQLRIAKCRMNWNEGYDRKTVPDLTGHRCGPVHTYVQRLVTGQAPGTATVMPSPVLLLQLQSWRRTWLQLQFG